MADYQSMPGCGAVNYAPKVAGLSAQRREAEAVLMKIPGVQGVGEGRDAIGNPAWIAYVREAWIGSRLPSLLAGRSVVPLVTGEISIRQGE
jgi:hypothetical protein